MLDWRNNRDVLHNHLKRDLKHLDNGTLFIIDSYNIKDLSNDVIDFYVNSFNNLNIRRIEFYYEVKYYEKSFPKESINNLTNSIDINSKILISFLGLLFNSLNIKDSNFNNRLKEKYFKKQENYDPFENTLKLIQRLSNIEIIFKPYKILNNDYHVHGRYWFGYENNELKGYIVDGSLNTVSNNIVIAQAMDSENANIIGTLFKDKINLNQIDLINLTSNDIHDINEKIKAYLCYF